MMDEEAVVIKTGYCNPRHLDGKFSFKVLAMRSEYADYYSLLYLRGVYPFLLVTIRGMSLALKPIDNIILTRHRLNSGHYRLLRT